MRTHGLSKSRILAGLQCPKRLYLATYHPELVEESDSTQDAYSVGHQVGELARTFYPGGHLIGHDRNLKQALEETTTLLSDSGSAVLFEATFQHDGVLVRTDILHKRDEGLHVTEVKAATSVKEEYLPDCAIQAWVLREAGHGLVRMELAHVDSSFVYPGNKNYGGLLVYADLTEVIEPLIAQVPQWVAECREVLAEPEPEVEVGSQCYSPYECPFLAYCSRDFPEYPVSCLPNKGKIVRELLEEGIEDIRDIPEGRLTSALQERARRATVTGQPELDPAAGEFLRGLPYPRYYLDFETVSFAVPTWVGTRPYQMLPFQWSCHIEQADGTLTHSEFLDTTGESPMRLLAEKLVATLGEAGPVFSYTTFEKTVLTQLAGLYPDLAPILEGLIDRLVDLYPLTKQHYYHPAMKGSWSIKVVLPTVAPDLHYGDLEEVQDGMAAGRAYQEIIHGETEEDRREKLDQAMREYCKLDTLAMVLLAHFLQRGSAPDSNG